MEPSRETLDRYELRTVLARSATGVVYEGWDSRIARKVAIKAVNLPDADDAELQDKLGRFKREAQAAGRLQHPNIVGIYDYGETDEIAFIVMEFVDGVSLKALFDRHERFEMPMMLRVMDAVLAALQYSHDRGIIHRDVKPSNIMLTADGRAKIADFGIARIESSSMTQIGTVMGTPSYMSPEQFLGETVDARTDVYSAGVVLYQMLTGERPYEGGVATIMHKVLHTDAVKPSRISTQSSAMLDAVVARAMAKRREDRFATAAAFADALHTAMDMTMLIRAPMASASERPPAQTAPGAPPRPALPRPASPRPASPRPAVPSVAAPARRPAASTLATALIAGLLVLGGVGGGAAWLTRSGPPKPPPPLPMPSPAPVPAAVSPAPAPAPAPAPSSTPPAPTVHELPAPSREPSAPAQLPPPALAAPLAPKPPLELLAAPSPLEGARPGNPQAPANLPFPPPAPPDLALALSPPPPLAARPRRSCEHPHFALRTGGSVAVLRVVNDGQACGTTLWADSRRHIPLAALILAAPPAHGTVRLKGSEYAYVPAPGFTGPDSFRVEAPPSHSIRFDVTVFPPRNDQARNNFVPTELAGPNAPAPSPSGLAPAKKPTPWIGFHVAPLSGEVASELGLGGPAGVLVTSVDGGGPAEKARLRPRDVVLAFNGTVLSGPESLTRAVQAASIGDAATVEIWRDRRLMTLQIETGQAPTPAGRAGPAD